MAAGGSQTTYVDGNIDGATGCRTACKECNNCPARANLIKKGKNPNQVVVNDLELRTILDPKKVKPHGLYLLCGNSDPFIEEMEVVWERLVKMLRARQDALFLALTKRLPAAARFEARFGVVPNLWLGTSAGRQESFNQRIPELFAIPAAGYVISLQPLREQINLVSALHQPGLKLVVSGCEIGLDVWRCPKDWTDSIKSQCRKFKVDCFITRWVDEQGHVHVSPTRNGRGSKDKSRPSFNPHRRASWWPTIGERYFKKAS